MRLRNALLQYQPCSNAFALDTAILNWILHFLPGTHLKTYRRFLRPGALAAALLVLLAGCGGSTVDAPALQPSLLAAVSSTGTSTTFSGNRSAYTITPSGNTFSVKDNATGVPTLIATTVETLVFADVSVNLNIGKSALTISAADLNTLIEIYIGFFGRVADADGLKFWIDKRAAGWSLELIANSFYDAAISPQYSALTGYAPGMSDRNFITIVYRNVLYRPTPDTAGVDYWLAWLAQPNRSRGALVLEMLTAAHAFKGNAEFGFVPDRLDNLITVGKFATVQQGLNFSTYAQSVAIATKVTPTDTTAALAEVGVADTAFNLPTYLWASGAGADVLMYRKPTTITITGQNLDQGISMTAPACSGIAEVAGGTATRRSFTCTPTATGTLQFSVSKSADSSILLLLNAVIPQPQITMKTSMGDMVLELNPVNAPITTNNFLVYVNESFYTNTLIHRSVNSGIHIIQGGGFNTSFVQKPTYAPIKLEVPNGLLNKRGTIAMARLSSPVDSATAQFFINTQDNGFANDNLNGYAVFGYVVSGMDVAERIQVAPTTTGSAAGTTFQDIPYPIITVYSVTQTK